MAVQAIDRNIQNPIAKPAHTEVMFGKAAFISDRGHLHPVQTLRLFQPVSFGIGKRPDWVQMPSVRSEEHTSELQSLMRISYAVFCLKKKKENQNTTQ